MSNTTRSGRPASTEVRGESSRTSWRWRQRRRRRHATVSSVTAQISATPVQDLSHPFPESGQSPLASHRPSRCGGGTAPELRFSTFLSPLSTPPRYYPIRLFFSFALSRTVFLSAPRIVSYFRGSFFSRSSCTRAVPVV